MRLNISLYSDFRSVAGNKIALLLICVTALALNLVPQVKAHVTHTYLLFLIALSQQNLSYTKLSVICSVLFFNWKDPRMQL
jgi:hypothetical protein